MRSLKYTPSEHLRISHTAVIIRAESVNRKLGVTVAEFARLFQLWGLTNGRIWVLAERAYPRKELKRIIGEILKPLGLIEREDWVPANERDCSNDHYDSRFQFQKIPELEDLPWLDSILLEDGNWIWYKNTYHLNKKNYGLLK